MRSKFRLNSLNRVWNYLMGDRPTTRSRKKPLTRRLGMESLESRDVPSTVLYDRDFSSSTVAHRAPGVTATWSHTTKSTSPSGEAFLGQFSNHTVTLTLGNLPAHDGLTVEFDLYLLKSWDGNDSRWGSDSWSFAIDGSTQVDATFRNGRTVADPTPSQNQSYSPETPLGGGPFESGSGAVAVNTLGYTFTNAEGTQAMDSTYHFSIPVEHGASSVTLTFRGSGLQGISDESWGLDNVTVVADATSVVTVERLQDASEGEANGLFRFTRTGDTSQPLTVGYSVYGSADADSDYEALPGAVTFAAGEAIQDIAVIPIDDQEVEDAEGVIVTLARDTNANYVVGSAGEAVLSIIDNESPVVGIEAIQDAEEGVEGTPGSFLFTRTGGDAEDPLTITYSVSGDAVAGVDYQSLSGSVTFEAGAQSVVVQVLPINNSSVGDNKAVIATLMESGAYDIDADYPSASLLILDDEPILSVEAASDAYEDGEIAGKFWVARTGDLSQALEVAIATSGEATPGGDYLALPSALYFPAGVDQLIVNIAPIADAIEEGDETVTLTLLPSLTGAYGLGEAFLATLTLVDKEVSHTLSLTIGGAKAESKDKAKNIHINDDFDEEQVKDANTYYPDYMPNPTSKKYEIKSDDTDVVDGLLTLPNVQGSLTWRTGPNVKAYWKDGGGQWVLVENKVSFQSENPIELKIEGVQKVGAGSINVDFVPNEGIKQSVSAYYTVFSGLIVKGYSDESINQFRTQVGDAAGWELKGRDLKTGEVWRTAGSRNPLAWQTTVRSYLDQIFSSESRTKEYATRVPNIVFDDFGNQTSSQDPTSVDPGDYAQALRVFQGGPAGEGRKWVAAMITHALWEHYQKQVNGITSYKDAHARACDAEAAVFIGEGTRSGGDKIEKEDAKNKQRLWIYKYGSISVEILWSYAKPANPVEITRKS